jgi:hypothetical protein
VSASASPIGVGFYFLDVLSCLLFCITLVLTSARFGRELSVELDLPKAPSHERGGAEVIAPAISVRSEQGEPRIYLEDEPVSLAALEARLRADPPPSVVLRSEDSLLARVIAAAHAAGVRDIQLAYAATTPRTQER